ncbi:hypothetical protein NIES2109_22650 [Nostoc sp. HK-01]|nr:hypothetical protein NIES2109_22650 [Nostoc sp. HK-01]
MNTYQVEGDNVETLLTRKEAADILGTNPRRLFDYLKAGALFLPRFERFKCSKGGISRTAMISNWDIESLKRIQQAFKKYGSPGKARKYISENPHEFN